MLAYDVADKASFDYLNELIRVIDSYNVKNAIKVVVGNNCESQHKEVDKKEAERFAKSIGAKFFEVSPVNGTNVNEAFMSLTQDVYERANGDLKESVVCANTNEISSKRVVVIEMKP